MQTTETLPSDRKPDAIAPKVSTWEGILRRNKHLNRTQVSIIEAFVQNPNASRAKLAEIVGTDDSTVSRWMKTPEFWQIVGTLGMAETLGSKADTLLCALAENMLDRIDKLGAEDMAAIKLIGQRVGMFQERPAVQVAVSVGTSDSLREARERAESLQRELFNGDSVLVGRVADSNGQRAEIAETCGAGVGAGVGGAA